MQKISLVLSGAGTRATAHIGVMRALLEDGYEIESISATSAGAVVGALYADGNALDEVYEKIVSVDYKKFFKFRPFGNGLFGFEKGIEYLDSNLKTKNLESLQTPLYVCVCDIQNGEIGFLNHGNIARAVGASCAILPLLKPIEIDGVLYADGGVMNNLPYEPIEDRDTMIVGVNVNPMLRYSGSGFFSYSYRTLFLLFYSNIYAKKNVCDIYIEPKGLEKYSVFNTKVFKECHDLGYEYTKKLLKEVRFV